MKDQVVWLITISFLAMLAVFLVAVDASQKGEVSAWLCQRLLRPSGISATSFTASEIANPGPGGTGIRVPAHFAAFRSWNAVPETEPAISFPVEPQDETREFPAQPVRKPPTLLPSQTIDRSLFRASELTIDELERAPAAEDSHAPTQADGRRGQEPLNPVIPPVSLPAVNPAANWTDDEPPTEEQDHQDPAPNLPEREAAIPAGSTIDQPAENPHGVPAPSSEVASQGGTAWNPDSAVGHHPSMLPSILTPIAPAETGQPPFEGGIPAGPVPGQDGNTGERIPGDAGIRISGAAVAEPVLTGSVLVAGPEDGAEEARPATPWPHPTTLVRLVEEAAGHEISRDWAIGTLQILDQFSALGSIDDSGIETLLSQLANQINVLDSLIVRCSTVVVQSSDMAAGPQAAELRTLSQQLVQFWSIAGATYRLAVLAPELLAPKPGKIPVVQASSTRILLPELEPAWEEYLMLPELRSELQSAVPDARGARRASLRLLARLSSPVMTEDQLKHAMGLFDIETLDAIRRLAHEPVDPRQTLTDLDDWQRTGHGYYGARLASTMQGLGWQDHETARELAKTLDSQLRSANLRLSVSGEMLNRLLPEQEEIAQPVNEQLLGADVRGHSRIANRLQIRLIPDPQQIQMRLESSGLVRSRTEASQRGFVIDNVGDSKFQAFKLLAIGRNGIVADRPKVAASSSSRVVGMRSRFDSLPVFGWVARQMASRQIEEQSPVANQLVERKLKSEVSQRFEEQIDAHLFELQDYLARTLVQPLTALELEPTPLEMRSTEDRIVMQYRMAGRDQLAAGSARPMGLHNSLISMQVHESLINNVLGRIDLAGQSFTGEELTRHFVQVFGQQANPDSGSGGNFRLVFASHDPLAIHFREGAAVVELNIRSLQIGKGKIRKNLIVQVTFHPAIQGSRLVMVQDNGGIRLKGSRLGAGDQAVLRTVFTAMFRSQYEFNLIPAGITQRLNSEVSASQFELNHGWLAASFDLAGTPVAHPPASIRPAGEHSHRMEDVAPLRR